MMLAVLCLLTVAACTTSAHAAAFTPGNVVIYRVGNGAAALDESGAAVFLDEYTPTGTLVQSIALPATDPDGAGPSRPLIAGFSSSDEGLLTRSVDGRYLLAPGYGRAVGGGGFIWQTTPASVPRVIARIDGAGVADTTTALSDLAGIPQSAASPDGTALYATSTAFSLRYKNGLGAGTSTSLTTGTLEFTQVAVFDGQLYAAWYSQSGDSFVGTVGSGLPTTSGQTATSLPGVPSSLLVRYGFVLLDLSATVVGLDTLYIADNAVAKIQKFTKGNGGSWTASGTMTVPDVAGLTARVQGTTVTLFATRSWDQSGDPVGTLYGATDASGYGGALSGTVTTLATATANKAFRGVALVPSTPPAAGSVVIDELRGGGATASDDYVNLFNRSGSPVDVSGWKLQSTNNAGVVSSLQLPSVPVIPAKGRLLLTNQMAGGYSLGSLASFDRFLPGTQDLPADGSVQLIDSSNVTQDAVRFAGSGIGEGSPLGTFPTAGQYAFVRIANRTGTGANYGLPKDTGDNASDFALVTTDPLVPAGSVLSAVEGVPGPVNVTGAPLVNGAISVTSVDPGVAATASPNRQSTAADPDGAGPAVSTLYLRRKVTNISGSPLTSLRFRTSDLTTAQSNPVAGRAILRVLNSDSATVPLSGGGTATIRPTVLQTTGVTPLLNGGGLNSVLTVPSVTSGTPLANGASIDVEFRLGLQTGGSFSAIFNTEAK
jgi:hypothetical protein